jgi:hypothetical protein
MCSEFPPPVRPEFTRGVWACVNQSQNLSKRNGKKNSVAWVREKTLPTERPPRVDDVSAKFADRGCRTDPYGRNLDFLGQSRYFFSQVAPQLYSRGWVDPVPDRLLLRKSGSTGNRSWASGSVAKNSDH